eukprot:SRR837773.9816.p2 GENE.SRR837773.9816~~SRR837773.9816.p2  ORF type:complete len:124 (-),score=45.00 SRR837773.9816:48-419(-)
MSIVLVMVVFPAWRLYILRAERDLAEDEADEGKYLLKVAAQQHREMFLDKEVDESALDLAHLKMKHHRRAALGGVSLAQRAAAAKLKHLRVTAAGIVEVDEPRPEQRRKRSTAHSEITQSLLA